MNSHPPRFRFPELVTLPWATFDGNRRETREEEINQLQTSGDLQDRLRYLGDR